MGSLRNVYNISESFLPMTFPVFLRCSVGLGLSIGLFAQGGGRGSGIGTLPGNPTNPTRPGMPSEPAQPDVTAPDLRPVLLMGKVVMEDGTPPPDSVAIQLVCRATPRSVGYTDPKGGFAVDLNDRKNAATFADASEDPNSFGGNTTRANSSLNSDSNGNSGITGRSLMGCDLRATLAGFRSDVLHLDARHGLDNPEVGTIILHRLANVEGLTISATSAFAPKDARIAFEKAQNFERQQKWRDADKGFRKAVDIYPKYAVAWYQLGLVQEQEKDPEAARKSYTRSIAADGKFVSPYQALAVMAAQEQKWQEVVKDTDDLLRLNPVDFPQAWLFNALGNYYLKNMDASEKSAREGISHDAAHHYPDLHHVLGVALAMKRDYPGAVEQLREYLQYAPNAIDSEEVKRQLAEVERVMRPEAKKEKPDAGKQ
jgi:tetratricopeptide (TPR) repeat protein